MDTLGEIGLPPRSPCGVELAGVVPVALAGDPMAGPDREPVQPGFPGRWLTKGAEVPPRQQKGFLEGVVGVLGTAKDQLRCSVQFRDCRTDEGLEGIVVSGACALDQLRLRRPPVRHGASS